MSELDEIMEGKHEIKHLHIEEDTIAFETELDNHTWNLTPRDIEIIIYCLQRELQQKETIIKEVREYIKQSGQYLEDIKRFNVDVLEPNYLDILKILDKVGDEK